MQGTNKLHIHIFRYLFYIENFKILNEETKRINANHSSFSGGK